MTSQRITLLGSTLLAITFALVALQPTGCSTEPERDRLDWQPSWPRTQMVVLRGSPGSRGPFVFRFRMPDGYWTHPHRHPVDARIRVVSGSYLLGKGPVLDPTAAETLLPGSEISVAAGTVHFDGALGQTVIEVSGTGPWGITFLDPSKDPAAAMADRAAAPPREELPLPPELDAYVQAALREWEIPGAAIAVVKDAKPVALHAYGVRELGKPEPVDVDTIFDVASLTKSFTAAAIATLVDEGRLAWDDPVQKQLPTLQFADPYLTANVTLRDLLCHRTGVAATNSAWYFTSLSRTQLLGLVAHMRMDAPFRTGLVYSNVGYTIAGEAAAVAAQMSWEDLVTRRLFVPLGMTRTTADFDAAPAMGNCASGHAMLGNASVYEDPAPKGYALRPTPRETTRKSVAPCGSVQSSAADLAKWILFQLGDGMHEGKRILAAASMQQMHSPQVLFATTPAMRAARQVRFFGGYGLGWQVMDYRGQPILWHTGAGDGQRAYMALLPEMKLGIVVLLNSAKVESLHLALATRIADHYLGWPTRDYGAELREPWTADLRAWETAECERRAARRTGTAPSLALGEYAGTYRDQLGLDVTVVEEGGGLVLRYGGGERANLVHWHDDTFVTRWENPLYADERSTHVSFEIGEPSGGEPRGGEPSGRKHSRVVRLHMTLGRDAVDAERAAQ